MAAAAPDAASSPSCVFLPDPAFESGKRPPVLPSPEDPSSSDWVVVFDFDWSLVNENTDTFCAMKALGADEGRKLVSEASTRSKTIGWTRAMDEMHQKLLEMGFGADRMLAAVAETPMPGELVSAVKRLAAQKVPSVIVSDANDLFILAVLERQGLTVSEDMAKTHPQFARLVAAPGDTPHFAMMATNPASLAESSPKTEKSTTDSSPTAGVRVSIRAHDPAPTGCPRCPINMCKGRAVHAMLEHCGIISGRGGKRSRRIVYVGDGSGDFCPCSLLGSSDTVLARSEFALARLLGGAGSDIGCAVREWADGADLAAQLLEVVGATKH
jgi:pyridoxal phosphate phosphatase PHOSPHO2